ncbi:hypothetical protein [Vibrio fluvialis]|uniref:hypothetical protein n=1 Tax=Vibrio fluvialis TaxID=676 RepID=UPI00096BC278|nr:hypothetical protein [Vibrio fluvialis]
MIKIYIGGVISITLLVVSIYTSINYYLITFPGKFSTEHSDWGNFGSYFGGVTSPVISTLSLFIVFFTVYMQKKLLISQQEQNDILMSDRKRTEYINIINGQIDLVRIDLEICVKKVELERDFNELSSIATSKSNNSIEITNKFVRETAERNNVIKKYLNLIVWVHTVPYYNIFNIQEELADKLKEILVYQEKINKRYG